MPITTLPQINVTAPRVNSPDVNPFADTPGPGGQIAGFDDPSRGVPATFSWTPTAPPNQAAPNETTVLSIANGIKNGTFKVVNGIIHGAVGPIMGLGAFLRALNPIAVGTDLLQGKNPLTEAISAFQTTNNNIGNNGNRLFGNNGNTTTAANALGNAMGNATGTNPAGTNGSGSGGSFFDSLFGGGGGGSTGGNGGVFDPGAGAWGANSTVIPGDTGGGLFGAGAYANNQGLGPLGPGGAPNDPSLGSPSMGSSTGGGAIGAGDPANILNFNFGGDTQPTNLGGGTTPTGNITANPFGGTGGGNGAGYTYGSGLSSFPGLGMPYPNIPTPAPANPNGVNGIADRSATNDAAAQLSAQLGAAPYQYAAYNAAAPAYAATDAATQGQYLFGQGGPTTLAGQAGLLNNLQADPLLAQQNAVAMQQLGLGGYLSPSELRNVQQSSRGGFAARGLDATNASVVDEAMQTDTQQRNRLLQSMGMAQNVVGQNQNQAQISNAFTSNLLGQAANNLAPSNAATRAMFDPFNSYGADVSNTNYNAAQAAQIAKSNQAAALDIANGNNSAATSAGKSDMWGKIVASWLSCWVARSVFGADNPKWMQFRHWMLYESPVWFRDLYLAHGEKFALWLDKHPYLKPPIRLWMESRIKNMEGYHHAV